MAAANRNAITEFFFRHHPTIYRRTGGALGGSIGGSPVLLLNTVGRKSGKPRTNGLICVERDNGWAIAASWAGEPKHPEWYLNLMANPETTILWQGKTRTVRARQLEGEEREEVWREIVAQDEGFAVYEERTQGIREIPVVLLERNPLRILYGLTCSYYTGKLEAYFKAKGIPYHFVEMHRLQFDECAAATGVRQLPCVLEPDGTWLTDTTKIIEHFEAKEQEWSITPSDEVAAFCSLLLEDLFDEWYWRPALYYRWAHDDDAKLMSTELGRAMMWDMPLPQFLRGFFVLIRQRMVYLKKDGVTPETAPAIEKHYLESLHELEKIFSQRDFLFGETPCEADFGLFGPFCKHFFCDPTSGKLMREHAPNVVAWVARLWALDHRKLASEEPLAAMPDDLGFFMSMVSNDYMPYLKANEEACSRGATDVSYEAQGVSWSIPVAPYRVECLNDLRLAYEKLTEAGKRQIATLLDGSVIEMLEQPTTQITKESKIVGRLGLPL